MYTSSRKFFYVQTRKMNAAKTTKPLTLSKAIDGFVLSCEGRSLSSHTINDYRITCRKFLAHVGDVAINSIQTSQVYAFLAAFGVGGCVSWARR